MKILIVSDTHRHNENLEIVLNKVKPIDMLIHLGDAEGTEDYITAIADTTCYFVAGNNDFFSRLDKEKIIEIGNYKAFLTHGHYYYVTVGIQNLVNEGNARGVDIVMYGHTHRPQIEIIDNLVVLNPGSLSYPRQDGRQPSYIIMEIDDKGDAHYNLNYLLPKSQN